MLSTVSIEDIPNFRSFTLHSTAIAWDAPNRPLRGMLGIGSEHQILAGTVGHVLIKDLIRPFRVFKLPAQGFKLF